MNLNLSHFKKVKEDESSATLMHPKGHQIKISKKALSSQMQQELTSLPTHYDEGGSVDEQNSNPSAQKPTTVINIGQPQPAASIRSIGEGEQVAQNFVPPPMVDLNQPNPQPVEQQGPATPSANDQYQLKVQDRLQSLRNQNYSHQPDNVLQKQAENEVLNSQYEQKQEGEEAAKNATQRAADEQKLIGQRQFEHWNQDVAYIKDQNVKRQSLGLSPLPLPIPPALPQAQNQATLSSNNANGIGVVSQTIHPQPKPQAGPQDLFGTQAYYDAYSKGLGEQKAGIQNEAAAQAQQGQMAAKLLDQTISQQQSQAQRYGQELNGLNQERAAFLSDVQKQHIDPQHYLNSMGTSGKIATAVGLILGGMGGGLMHQANPALEFLNKQIANDIEAQKGNLGKSENLLNANLRQFGNLHDAMQMTQVMQMDIVKNQLAQAAAVSSDPQAKARAQIAMGQIDQQAAPILSQMAARKVLLAGPAQGQPANQGSPNGIDPSYIIKAVAPEKEQESLQKDLKSAQNMATQRDNLLGAFADLDKNNTLFNRVTSPIQTSKQVASVREPLLAQLVKDAEGRITPTDVEMLRGLFPAVGDNSETIRVKRAQMKNFIDEKMNFPSLKPYGINPLNFGRNQASGTSKFKETAPNLGQ